MPLPKPTGDALRVPPTAVGGSLSEPSVRLFLQGFGFGFVSCLLLVGLFAWMARRPDPSSIVLQPPPTPLPPATPLPTATPAPIVVFVSGAVAFPGVYSLPSDARVGDALIAAGDLLDSALSVSINQAERLWDGAQVHVPSAADPVAAGAPDAGVSGVAPPAQNTSTSSGGGRVNLNTASAEALATLPGIGPAKAEAIIAGRPYVSIDDLDRVSGIGAKTIDLFRELVTVD